MVVVLVSIPNTIQTIQINNIDFNEMIKVNDNKPSFDKYKGCIVHDNIFIICDHNFGTYGYISMSQLLKYPESYITTHCNHELEYNSNRIIIIECNEDAIQAIVRFYCNGQWELEYLKDAYISNVIPKECSKMKYKELYILEFLQLPSCYTEKQINDYASKLGNKDKKKKKKFKPKSIEEKLVDDFYKNVPKEYINSIDDDMIDCIMEGAVLENYISDDNDDYYDDLDNHYDHHSERIY